MDGWTDDDDAEVTMTDTRQLRSHAGPVVDVTVGYHATPNENIAAIQREGLLAAGAIGHGFKVVPAVHMDTVELHAVGFIMCLYDLPDNTCACFQVNLEGLVVREGWDGPGTLAVEEDIAPERLTLLYDGTGKT